MQTMDDLRAFCTCPPDRVDAFLPPILEFFTTSTASKIGVVGLVDHESAQWLRFRARYVVGPDPSPWMYGQQLLLPIGGAALPPEQRSLCGYVAHIREPQRVGQVTDYPFYHLINTDVQSELAVPILWGDVVLGVLDVEGERADFYTEADEKFLCEVAASMAEPLHGLLTREGVGSHLLRALQEINTFLHSAHAPAQVDPFLQELLRRVRDYTGSTIAFLSLVSEESLTWLRVQAQHVVGPDLSGWMYGGPELWLPIGDTELPPEVCSLSGYVAHTKQAERVTQVAGHRFSKSAPPGVRSALAVPILRDHTLLAWIPMSLKAPKFLGNPRLKVQKKT